MLVYLSLLLASVASATAADATATTAAAPFLTPPSPFTDELRAKVLAYRDAMKAKPPSRNLRDEIKVHDLVVETFLDPECTMPGRNIVYHGDYCHDFGFPVKFGYSVRDEGGVKNIYQTAIIYEGMPDCTGSSPYPPEEEPLYAGPGPAQQGACTNYLGYNARVYVSGKDVMKDAPGLHQVFYEESNYDPCRPKPKAKKVHSRGAVHVAINHEACIVDNVQVNSASTLVTDCDEHGFHYHHFDNPNCEGDRGELMYYENIPQCESWSGIRFPADIYYNGGVQMICKNQPPPGGAP